MRPVPLPILCLGFWVYGFGLRVWGLGIRVQVLGFWGWGSGFRLWWGRESACDPTLIPSLGRWSCKAIPSQGGRLREASTPCLNHEHGFPPFALDHLRKWEKN